SEVLARLRADIAEKPDGVLEELAARHGVPFRTVLDALPEGQAVAVPGARFEDVWADLTDWGAIMLIVHTGD
ncbi:ChuX/HutX family heme-like substrate-binding protein, partial [Escherichia coli]